ncbi:rubrerythrin [Parcubacteria bacterium SG8_24]|nr:MAG: rubrerythrin [Parcubacteria bacterium SG8_24]
MLAQIPFDLKKIAQEDLDNQLLRVGLIAELDAINLYEQMAELTQDEHIKKVFMAVAKEEKEHVGEFQALLLARDAEQVKELEEGRQEVEELKP